MTTAIFDPNNATDVLAIAKLYGEPLFDVPKDLYIPPEALEIFLEAFEGPLDLLLYLIRRQNFNILDIPLAKVTTQYLKFVEEIKNHNLELAAEYLLMAALLIEIKSRMLLPVVKSSDTQEVEDPRAELVRRLLEYERIKSAAQHLAQIPQLGRNYFATQVKVILDEQPDFLPQVNIEDLQLAWQGILHRTKMNTKHVITREALSVREFMTIILRKLQDNRFVNFADLFEEALNSEMARSNVVVNFIAILELTKEELITITQAEPYAPIYVCLSYSSAS